MKTSLLKSAKYHLILVEIFFAQGTLFGSILKVKDIDI